MSGLRDGWLSNLAVASQSIRLGFHPVLLLAACVPAGVLGLQPARGGSSTFPLQQRRPVCAWSLVTLHAEVSFESLGLPVGID